jgi:hypothetical protein
LFPGLNVVSADPELIIVLLEERAWTVNKRASDDTGILPISMVAVPVTVLTSKLLAIVSMSEPLMVTAMVAVAGDKSFETLFGD